MKIVMNCLPAASGGGIAIVRHLVSPLADAMANAGHQITFLLHDQQADLVPSLDHAMVKWVSEPVAGWRRLLWERRHLGQVLSDARADLLFTPYQVAARFHHVKNVLMLTNMEPFLHWRFTYSTANRLRNTLLQMASYRSLRAADRVIAISKFTQRYLQDPIKVPQQRIRMVYHGRNTAMAPIADASADLATLSGTGLTDPFVLTCGSLLPYRRCEDVIAAFQRCVDRLPQGTRLAIAGTGTDRSYRALLASLVEASPVSDRICLLGHVPSPVMAALYRRSVACVIASEIEACPNIAIEAMTAGCAIIASDKAPLPEIFSDGASFYRARDVNGLAEAIATIVSSSAETAAMRTRALQRARSFCWQAAARETCEALCEWP
jgi:glycosyltransferase involved in cell wall biosynthesis